jgi:hypothetical protein
MPKDCEPMNLESIQHDRRPFSSTHFILILIGCMVLGLIISPDLLRFYAGKPDLLISEFMAENKSIRADGDGDFSDWIEIYNASDQVQSLEGWSLTDDFSQFRKWTFPPITLKPGAFLLVWASGKHRTNWMGDLHTNFKLSSSGEYLALIRPNGRTVAHEYLPKYPKQQADVSFGLNEGHFQDRGWSGKEPLRDYAYFLDPSPLAANPEGMISLRSLPQLTSESSEPSQTPPQP